MEERATVVEATERLAEGKACRVEAEEAAEMAVEVAMVAVGTRRARHSRASGASPLSSRESC